MPCNSIRSGKHQSGHLPMWILFHRRSICCVCVARRRVFFSMQIVSAKCRKMERNGWKRLLFITICTPVFAFSLGHSKLQLPNSPKVQGLKPFPGRFAFLRHGNEGGLRGSSILRLDGYKMVTHSFGRNAWQKSKHFSKIHGVFSLMHAFVHNCCTGPWQVSKLQKSSKN